MMISRYRFGALTKLLARQVTQRPRKGRKSTPEAGELQLFIRNLEDRRVLSASSVSADLLTTTDSVGAVVSAPVVTAQTVSTASQASSAKVFANQAATQQSSSQADSQFRADAAATLLGAAISLPAGSPGGKYAVLLQANAETADTPVAGEPSNSDPA